MFASLWDGLRHDMGGIVPYSKHRYIILPDWAFFCRSYFHEKFFSRKGAKTQRMTKTQSVVFFVLL
jgi:hypothetical protein